MTKHLAAAATRCLVASLGLLLGVLPVRASSLGKALRPERMVLDNGLEIWLKPQPGSPSVSLVAGVKVGQRYESLRQRGLAHFVEHMVFQGTRHRSHEALEREVRERGGSRWGSTGEDVTSIGLDLPPQEFKFGLEWLADVLFRPTFPADRIAVTRKIIFRERADEPPQDLLSRLNHALFGTNSIVQQPQDHKRELRNTKQGLQRDDLLRFYKEQYVPNNIVLVLVGEFDPQTARLQVERAFGSFPRHRDPPRGAHSLPSLPRKPVRVAAPSSLDVNDCAVWCGYVIPECGLEDFTLLQWGLWLASVRVADHLREEEGLSYDLSWEASYRTVGSLVWIEADSSLRDMRAVERIIREELERLPSEALSDTDIAFVKASVARGWREFAQSNQELAELFLGWAVSNGSPINVEALLAGLTADKLRAAAHTYLKSERSFSAYYRPPVTPGQVIGTLALTLTLLAGLVILAHGRNERLARQGERLEVVLRSRYTPRLVAAQLPGLAIGIAIAAPVAWLLAQAPRLLFDRAMFGPSFACLSFSTILVVPALVMVALTGSARRVAVSRDGLLVQTRGFHVLLRPQNIASIRSDRVSLLRCAIDPRCIMLGGDGDRWVIVRTVRGFSLCLSLDDSDQFARDAAELLGMSAHGATAQLQCADTARR